MQTTQVDTAGAPASLAVNGRSGGRDLSRGGARVPPGNSGLRSDIAVVYWCHDGRTVPKRPARVRYWVTVCDLTRRGGGGA